MEPFHGARSHRPNIVTLSKTTSQKPNQLSHCGAQPVHSSKDYLSAPALTVFPLSHQPPSVPSRSDRHSLKPPKIRVTAHKESQTIPEGQQNQHVPRCLAHSPVPRPGGFHSAETFYLLESQAAPPQGWVRIPYSPAPRHRSHPLHHKGHRPFSCPIDPPLCGVRGLAPLVCCWVRSTPHGTGNERTQVGKNE